MDQQLIAQHIVEIMSGVGGLFVLLFKYRETIEFVVKVAKFLWKPFKCIAELVKMPFHLSEQASHAQKRIDKIESLVSDLSNSFAEMNKFVKKELTYNGGSSTRDAIGRLEKLMREQEFAQNALMQDSECGLFKCSKDGKNMWVNRTYARYLGCGTGELLGLGWKRFIRTEELKRYNEVWQGAFRDGCEFENVVEFVNTHGQMVALKIFALPIIDEKGNAVSYVGTVVAL